jgi:tRNA threonylcarbamoyladenosine biosynthesis protein TsaB
LVVDGNSFAAFLLSGKVLFCGNGVKKLQPILSDGNALFSNTVADASHLAELSFTCYSKKEFTGLAYAEPLYVKEFHFSGRKN